MVGQFCQGFCLRYAYADWNPRFLINLMPDITANAVEWFRQACQVCKSLLSMLYTSIVGKRASNRLMTRSLMSPYKA